MTQHDASLDTLEQALVTAAYLVLRHGPAYTPLLERLEAEVEQARKLDSARERAQRILMKLKPAGHVPALAGV